MITVSEGKAYLIHNCRRKRHVSKVGGGLAEGCASLEPEGNGETGVGCGGGEGWWRFWAKKRVMARL